MNKNIENKSGVLIGSGIVAAFIASLCCVGPLLLTLLGVSGAAVLSKIEVIRIPLIILVVIVFAIAGKILYRKRDTCEPNSICADPKKYTRMVAAYWIGLAIALIALTSPWWIPLIFG